MLINKELIESVRRTAEEDKQKHQLLTVISNQKKAIEELEIRIEEQRGSQGATNVYTVNIQQI